MIVWKWEKRHDTPHKWLLLICVTAKSNPFFNIRILMSALDMSFFLLTILQHRSTSCHLLIGPKALDSFLAAVHVLS